MCEENDDPELKAFLVLAPTTGMRKGEILSRKWSDIDLDSSNPCIYVRLTKNDEPKRIQLPDMAVTALRALPSVITSNPATCDHFKSGQRGRTQDMKLFYRAGAGSGKFYSASL
jgi:integrase